MRLSEAEYAQYYASLGIGPDDLRSDDPLTLAELPAEAGLSAAELQRVQPFLPTWNRLDRLAKVDAAQALSRRVLAARSPKPAELWAAYLMLGRLRQGATMQADLLRVARGEPVGRAPCPRSVP